MKKLAVTMMVGTALAVGAYFGGVETQAAPVMTAGGNAKSATVTPVNRRVMNSRMRQVQPGPSQGMSQFKSSPHRYSYGVRPAGSKTRGQY